MLSDGSSDLPVGREQPYDHTQTWAPGRFTPTSQGDAHQEHSEDDSFSSVILTPPGSNPDDEQNEWVQIHANTSLSREGPLSNYPPAIGPSAGQATQQDLQDFADRTDIAASAIPPPQGWTPYLPNPSIPDPLLMSDVPGGTGAEIDPVYSSLGLNTFSGPTNMAALDYGGMLPSEIFPFWNDSLWLPDDSFAAANTQYTMPMYNCFSFAQSDNILPLQSTSGYANIPNEPGLALTDHGNSLLVPRPPPYQNTRDVTTIPKNISKVTKRRHPAQGSKELEQLKLMRRQGACLRCRIYKEKCDFGIPCGNCRKVFASAKVFKQPCTRLSLKDVITFRAGNSRQGQTRSAFPKLAWSFDEPDSRTATIAQEFTNLHGRPVPTLNVLCRKFLPGPHDTMVEPATGSDGSSMLLCFTPYACVEAETTTMQRKVECYLNECMELAEEEIDLMTTDPLVRLGVREARRFASLRPTSVVSSCLKIQALVAMATKPSILVGRDTLDMMPMNDPRFPMYGKVQVPGVLDYQLDTLWIHYMQRLIKDVTRGLKKLIFAKNNTANWFEIFLAVFVQLTTLEHVYISQIQYLSRYLGNENDAYINANYVSRYMMQEWRASAKNLLYHFRCILRGMIPFSISWSADREKHTQLDPESLAFVKNAAKILETRSEEMMDLKNCDMDNPTGRSLVWLAKLFLDD